MNSETRLNRSCLCRNSATFASVSGSSGLSEISLRMECIGSGEDRRGSGVNLPCGGCCGMEIGLAN